MWTIVETASWWCLVDKYVLCLPQEHILNSIASFACTTVRILLFSSIRRLSLPSRGVKTYPLQGRHLSPCPALRNIQSTMQPVRSKSKTLITSIPRLNHHIGTTWIPKRPARWKSALPVRTIFSVLRYWPLPSLARNLRRGLAMFVCIRIPPARAQCNVQNFSGLRHACFRSLSFALPIL